MHLKYSGNSRTEVASSDKGMCTSGSLQPSKGNAGIENIPDPQFPYMYTLC